MNNYNTETRFSLSELPGLLSLGALVLLLPMLSYEEESSLLRLISPLGILAFLTNLHHVRIGQVHPSMVCLAALFGYFAISGLLGNPGQTAGPLFGFAKFTVLALALSLVVRQRRQLLAVLCAMAVSAIYVAISEPWRGCGNAAGGQPGPENGEPELPTTPLGDIDVSTVREQECRYPSGALNLLGCGWYV